MTEPVTVRRLQRDTAAVLREVEGRARPVVVTRDGEEVAKIVPMDPSERRWRRWVRELGGDPDARDWQRGHDAAPLPAGSGAPLSEYLADLRADER